jgi:uncharacterized membrane protein
MAREVIVATFETRDQAYEAAYDIDRLPERVVDVKSGAIVEKDVLGNVKTLETRTLGSAWVLAGTVAGALVGILIGALAGPGGAAAGGAVGAAIASGPVAGSLLGGAAGATADAAEWVLKHGAIDDLSASLPPGQTALVMEVEQDPTAPVDAAVARHGGGVVRRPIVN